MPAEILRLTLWLGLLWLIFAPLERRFARRPVSSPALATGVAFYFLSSLLPKLLLLLPLSLAAGLAHDYLPSSYYAVLASLPTAVRLLAALVLGELGAYWAHRWSHELPLLWRFHSLHHAAEEMHWLVNTHAHPVDVTFTRLCGLLPLYLLGLAQPMAGSLDLVPVLVTIVGTLWGFFLHANINWRLGPLESVIASPAFHHWHHTNDGPETINKNYAALLPALDRLFGTHYLPPKAWPTRYGLDHPRSPNLLHQLLHPFQVKT